MTRLRLVPESELQTQAWANGAGTTTVLASGPEPEWQWRLSIADITRASDFSFHAGTRRQFVALDAPVHLRFRNAQDRSLPRLHVTHFDGTDAPHITLPYGPTRAFNLMFRGRGEGELIARPLNGNMWLPANASWCWFLHMLTGDAAVHAEGELITVSSGMSIWINAQHGERVRIEGGGELVLVKLLLPLP